jgi:lipoic acid synthetase/lipoate-protein ligase A
MLFDTNMENMVGAITPSDEKLVSKGVKSVRQHIALLKDYTDLTIGEFKEFVKSTLCNRELVLTEQDITAVEAIEEEYLSESFIVGNNPSYSTIRRQRVEGVGELEVRMQVKGSRIKDINLVGDYFLVGDLDGELLKPLKGVQLDAESISSALPERLDNIILNLSKEAFIQLILNYKTQ